MDSTTVFWHEFERRQSAVGKSSQQNLTQEKPTQIGPELTLELTTSAHIVKLCFASSVFATFVL